MTYTIRPLTSADESFLWEMLYEAVYVPEGQPVLPREIIQIPELARYVQGWGREGDCGLLYTIASQPIGAAWLRLPIGEHKGYGYIDDDIPELSIAVLPHYRGQGIGTQLLTHLLASEWGQVSISLSVSTDNPAARLYERFDFEVISKDEGSLLMKRNPKQGI